jgi:hypothetical protein
VIGSSLATKNGVDLFLNKMATSRSLSLFLDSLHPYSVVRDLQTPKCKSFLLTPNTAILFKTSAACRLRNKKNLAEIPLHPDGRHFDQRSHARNSWGMYRIVNMTEILRDSIIPPSRRSRDSDNSAFTVCRQRATSSSELMGCHRYFDPLFLRYSYIQYMRFSFDWP